MSTPAAGRPGSGDASRAADLAALAAGQAALAAEQAALAAERIAEPRAEVVVVTVDTSEPPTAELSIADEITARVLAVPDVTRMHAGRFGEVATYLPGRRVTGVKLSDDLIEVHVVVAGQIPVRQTAQSIHEAVASVIATPVHVFIEDVAAV